MGQAAGILKALDCSCLGDCAKYVLNSGRCHSTCCGTCCELSIQTDEISIASDDSGEERLEVAGGCLKWLKK